MTFAPSIAVYLEPRDVHRAKLQTCELCLHRFGRVESVGLTNSSCATRSPVQFGALRAGREPLHSDRSSRLSGSNREHFQAWRSTLATCRFELACRTSSGPGPGAPCAARGRLRANEQAI